MGDLHRHAEIFRHVHAALAPVRPDEDYVCLEMGNYLTDVSQFRDPFAFMLAKRTVWEKARARMWYINWIPVVGLLATEAALSWIVDLDEWIDQMFGVHEPVAKRYGKLAEYFSFVIRGITHLIFADDVPKAESWRPILAPAMGDIRRLAPGEVNRIYDSFFTQYYPHEHVDFPPYVLYGEHRVNRRLYRRGSRGLSNYLEEYTDYLAESLALLEVDWKASRDKAKSDPARHDILLRLGKILHGIEDYYFHSNYLELHLWNELRRGRPSTETDEQYRAWFVTRIADHWLPGEPDPVRATSAKWFPSKEHQVRSHMRRLRYPLYVPVNTLDPERSEPALDILFTAGFDKKDLMHTFSMALESLESSLTGVEDLFVTLPPDLQAKYGSKNPTRLRDSELVLIRTVFNKDERARMGRDADYLKQQQDLHAKQLKDGAYETSIRSLHAAGYLNASARDAWLSAIAVDRSMEDFGTLTPGAGGFLMALLSDAQHEVEKSRAKSRRFDGANDFGQANALDVRSDNGATGEHVGTHTLMAKDTATSRPVHEETRRVARFASMAVASILVKEVNANQSSASGTDWDRVLRHYLRFPAARPSMWESQVLAFFRANQRDATYDEIPDKVPPTVVSGPEAASRLARRRNGRVRGELEKRYHDLEERVDRFGLF